MQTHDSSPKALDPKPAQVPSKPDAERVATAWLNALRRGDRAQLGERTALPFELHELVKYPKCEPARAEKREQVVAALGCLLDDDLLVEQLVSQRAPVTEAVSMSELPAWAASLKAVPTPGQLVQVRLPGDGVSYQLLLLATQSGIAAVWKFAEYDSN